MADDRFERLTATRRVVVCAGAGGVGKTTIAAALSLAAARRGRRVLCLTIDPARRLADSLGLTLAPGVEAAWRLSPDVQGQGLATEGAAAAVDWAFANLALDEVVAFTAESNLASQAVMRLIGMAPDPSRDFDHPRLAPDHPLRRHVLYARMRG